MTREEVVKSREYQISNAACKYADSIAQHDDRKTYCIEDFEAGAEWADKHQEISIAFLVACEAAQESIVSKLQSLIEYWSHNDSPEGKYRLEAYKELMEFVVND